jgi:heptosyltransferase II
MKILIELPTWLGDAVMVTPAFENLVNSYHDPEVTLIGSLASVELFQNHPEVIQTIVIHKKYKDLYQISRNFKDFDAFFSFRSSFRSKILAFLISSNKKYLYEKHKFQTQHQVKKYNDFVNESLNINSSPGELKIIRKSILPIKSQTPHVGINPGASYGSSKQWIPKEYAKVAIELSKKYDIIIFGGTNEINISKEIENILKENGVVNVQNLAGTTSISDLIHNIANLDLFITGDSGPMHIAASFQIPTITIFGPTKDYETSQWKNNKSIVIKKNLECQPCMKRVCPLGHHNCMSLITSKDVLNAVKSLKLKIAL